MKKFLVVLFRQWAHSPIKVLLTLLAVSLGTFILILSFSVTNIIDEKVTDVLNAQGVIVHVANGTWDSEGNVDQTRPSEWDTSAGDYLISDTDSVEYTAIVSFSPFMELNVGGTSYNLRSSIATEPSYFDVFDLEVIAGVPMSEEDVSLGSRKVWLSEETAVLLFGSAEDAIGQWVQPPGFTMGRGMNSQEQNMVIQYSVAGVYETPSEITRNSYGIGDLLVPFTSFLPQGANASMAMNRMAGTMVIKSSETSVESAEAAIRQTLTQNYGDDIDIIVWEGSMRGETSYMQDLRKTVNVFTVSVNILGIVLMLVSTLGVFSIMLVEALSRKKHIALERALGASKGRIIQEFWIWSIAMSFLGVALGAIISYFVCPTVLSTISPLLGDLSTELDLTSGIDLKALLESAVLVLGFGGLFGLLPALPAVNDSIADVLKEA